MVINLVMLEKSLTGILFHMIKDVTSLRITVLATSYKGNLEFRAQYSYFPILYSSNGDIDGGGVIGGPTTFNCQLTTPKVHDQVFSD